jgi:aubergine-like protein
MERYNIKIQNMDQPLIVYRDKQNPNKKTCLIPELLNMTGLTNHQRADLQLMKDVAKFTRLTPEARNREILTLQGQLIAPLREKNIILDQDQRVPVNPILVS